MAQYPAQVVLNGSGAGTIRIQNNTISVVWIVRALSVRTNPKQSGVTADVFQNVYLHTTSYFAGTGDNASGDPPITLYAGEYIDVTFSNGPANGIGLATAYYDEVPR